MQNQLDIDFQIESGNAGAVDTNGTGWFVGYSDWCKDGLHNLRHTDELVKGPFVKWFAHPAGDPDGQVKPLSTGRSIALLVGEGGHFRLDFCAFPSFEPALTKTYILQRVGDFVAWGPGVYHRSFGVEASTILTLRWEPV